MESINFFLKYIIVIALIISFILAFKKSGNWKEYKKQYLKKHKENPSQASLAVISKLSKIAYSKNDRIRTKAKESKKKLKKSEPLV